MADVRVPTRSKVLPAAILAAVLAMTAPPVQPAFASAGDLDPSFGAGGRILTDFGAERNDSAYALALGGRGKIIVAGTAETKAGQRFALARYRPAGSLDPRFGGGGKVETGFGAGFQTARDVAVQPGGKVVVAGWANASGTTDFALARYRPDGRLDPTFGGDGRVLTNFGAGSTDQAEAVELLPDGRIVVAGRTLSATSAASDFALARYRTNGTLDPSFGGDGRITTDFGGNDDRAETITLQSDGGMVAAGSTSAGAASSFALARYTSSGALDPGFGGDGRVTTAFGGGPAEALDLAIDGSALVAVGSVFTGPQVRDHSFGLARYTSTGALAGGFGSGGRVVTDLGANGGDNVATSVAVASGKLLVAGDTSTLTSDYDHSFALVRYTSTGALDPAFGSDGAVRTNFGPGWDLARDVSVDDKGRMVVVGVASAVRGGDFALARYVGS